MFFQKNKFNELRKQLINTENKTNELRDRLINIENKTDNLSEQLINIQDKTKNLPELQQRLINIELKIDLLSDIIARVHKEKNYIFETTISGLSFLFQDALTSYTVPAVTREMKNSEYNFENIVFSPGDCVIDIGANVGIVSIYLAKKYPFLKIYAYEPVKRNYDNFVKNIKLNQIPDGIIFAENKAVTKDGRKIKMNFDIRNSGGSFGEEIDNHENINTGITDTIDSISLDNILQKYSIRNLKLLKMDCEGFEYEILYNTKLDNLKKIHAIRGEFHNSSKSKNAENLLNFVRKYIPNISIYIHEE